MANSFSFQWYLIDCQGLALKAKCLIWQVQWGLFRTCYRKLLHWPFCVSVNLCGGCKMDKIAVDWTVFVQRQQKCTLALHTGWFFIVWFVIDFRLPDDFGGRTRPHFLSKKMIGLKVDNQEKWESIEDKPL